MAFFLFPLWAWASSWSHMTYKVKVVSASKEKILLRIEDVLRADGFVGQSLYEDMKGQEIPIVTGPRAPGPYGGGTSEQILAGRELLHPRATLVATHYSYSNVGVSESQWSFVAIKESSSLAQKGPIFPKITLSHSRAQTEVHYPHESFFSFSLTIPSPEVGQSTPGSEHLSLTGPVEVELKVRNPLGEVETFHITLSPGTQGYLFPMEYKMNGTYELTWKIRSSEDLVAYGRRRAYLIGAFEMGNTEDSGGLRYLSSQGPSYSHRFEKITLLAKGVQSDDPSRQECQKILWPQGERRFVQFGKIDFPKDEDCFSLEEIPKDKRLDVSPSVSSSNVPKNIKFTFSSQGNVFEKTVKYAPQYTPPNPLKLQPAQRGKNVSFSIRSEAPEVLWAYYRIDLSVR